MENNQRSSSNPHLAKPVLCDGFLIPMTDFVLRINEIEKEIDQFFDSWRMKQLRIIENYAKFLKQPLKLEMFVGGRALFEGVATSQNLKGFWIELNNVSIGRYDSYDNYTEFNGVIKTVEDLQKEIRNIKLSQTALNAIFE